MSVPNLRPYGLLLAGLLSITCRRAEDPPRLFERLAPSATGVTVANRLPEDSSLNILNFLSYLDSSSAAWVTESSSPWTWREVA